MIFNSIDFAVFFPLVFLLYWLVFKHYIKSRNIFLLVVSYLFYGWWDWRFLSLIILSSLVDYAIGRQLGVQEKQFTRKMLLLISVAVNIGLLGFFKYFNFFIDSFVGAFSLFGSQLSYDRMHIILPVGISFYTFQTLSYTIDVYRRKLEPSRDIIGFFAFVSFFPQLVAGPIERASHLLPQFYSPKKFSYDDTRSGLLLIGWGLFKKIVIADRLAIFVNTAYANPDALEGLAAIFAIVFFAFQLYLDFSAYSDIAIGCARTLGFDLMVNFRRPYLASSFADFWGRWHISLSTWFRDYVYIPLGGNRNGQNNTIVNIMVVFLLSGLWHGASWNFVIWGALNGLFLVGFDKILAKSGSGFLSRILSGFIVTIFWMLSLVFFRAANIGDALTVLQNISPGWGDGLYKYGLNAAEFKFSVYLLVFLMFFEILIENRKLVTEKFFSSNLILRWSVYFSLVISIVFLGSYGIGANDNAFIYFQF